MSTTPDPKTAPAPAVKPAPKKALATKTVRKTPVSSKSKTTPASKKAAAPRAKAVVTTAVPAAVKSTIKPTALSTPKAAPKPTPRPVAKPAAATDTAKPKKAKLVRDSFTIPKAEYNVLEGLKLRSIKMGKPAKKSEILRAGIKALAAMSDNALAAALVAVPTIKTGRPKLS